MIQNEFEALLRHISFCLKTEIFSQFKKIIRNRRLHVAFLNRFCPSTRKHHSYWQQYHLIGVCLYNGPSVRDVIFLKSRRRQRERQRKKKVYIRKTTTLYVQHTFLYISLPSLHDCDVKFPQVTFRGGRKHRLDYKFLFLPSKLGGGPQEFNSREIHLHSTEILYQSKKSRPTLNSFK